MTVSTRIAIMDRGRTVQVGTPGEIYEYPNSLYVAEFLGEANVFEGRVVDAGKDHVRVSSQESGCDIYGDRGIEAAEGQRSSPRSARKRSRSPRHHRLIPRSTVFRGRFSTSAISVVGVSRATGQRRQGQSHRRQSALALKGQSPGKTGSGCSGRLRRA